MDKFILDIVRKSMLKKDLYIGEKGFNLIELTVALFLLTVGLLPLFGVFVSTSGVVSEGGRNTRAVAHAQDKIEEARSTHFDSLESGLDTIDIFVREWVIEDPYIVDTTTYDDIKQMIVTVLWNEEGKTHRVQWSSLFAETSEKE
jgi:prepilin-type N-terminal cleavage/methylation domain-containing protein